MSKQLVLLVAIGASLGACVPETDLTNISAGGDGAPGAGGPAGATLVDPVAGAIDVPLNLAAVVVRFPASVNWGEEGLRICDGGAGPIAAMPPVDEPCDGGACYRVPLAGRLPPAVACKVVIGAGATAAGGEPIAGGVVGIFDAAAEADETPPVLADLSIAAAGPCLDGQLRDRRAGDGERRPAGGRRRDDQPGGRRARPASTSRSR